MLKRVLKMLGAQGAVIVINLIAQFLLPPLFIRFYGIGPYGEWLVLSATLAYLSSLNFGITTYASNELTILRQRGELDLYRRLQASTLALLLGLVLLGSAFSALMGLLPLPSLLHLHFIGRRSAGWIAFFLGLQTMVHILGGYYNNLYMVIQEAHRGQMLANMRFFAPILAAAALAALHASFSTIAFVQLSAALVIAIATIFDLKRRLGKLPLGVRGASWTTMRAALAPSGMFALLLTQQFLLFQAPVILLQRLLGPEIVVLFTICRTILSTARRLLSTITNAIAPEITFSFGSGEMKKLLTIFHYSERVVFSLIPVANLGALLFSPLLLTVWLHKPGLFETYTYALMALVSAAMSMREHKQFFQFSTNVHHRLALIVFFGNLIMIAISIPTTWRFGLHGFMYTWLASEATQMGLLYVENKKLFGGDPSITLIPVAKLVLFMGVFLPLSLLLLRYGREHSMLVGALLAVGGTAVIFAVSYVVFGLNLVRRRLTTRFLGAQPSGSRIG